MASKIASGENLTKSCHDLNKHLSIGLRAESRLCIDSVDLCRYILLAVNRKERGLLER